MAEYNLLDTQAFEHFIEKAPELNQKYKELSKKYTSIAETLLSNWKGKGAEAFEKDVNTVSANISGIGDILSTMCDTLRDCREVFGECDTSLGASNKDAVGKK